MLIQECIKYIDFHTHRNISSDDTIIILNLFAGDAVSEDPSLNIYYSVGIHPWHVRAEDLDKSKTLFSEASANARVILIGEAGFDMIKGPAIEIQHEVFLYQAAIAEDMRKPIVIHCVRAYEHLIKTGKEFKPTVPWIIHGFRGGDRLAESLAGENFWFSLGIKGLSASLLKALPHDRIFLETDDTNGSIADVYKRFSDLSGISRDETIKMIKNNFVALFQKQ